MTTLQAAAVPRFPAALAALALAVAPAACDPAVEPPTADGPDAPGPSAATAPAALDWAGVQAGALAEGLRVGPAHVPAEALTEALIDLRATYSAWGAGTLAWYLLDGGMGAAALLHAAFPEASAAARAEAEALAGQLADGADFWALLQEHGAPEAPGADQPSPAALGGAVAAAVAPLEAGEWSGPVRTLDGWEIVLLDRRADGLRSRAAVVVRRIVVPVGDEEARNEARDGWARLPLDGDPALLRVLPRAFVRGRVPEASL